MPSPATIFITGANGFVGQHVLVALRRILPDAKLVAGIQHHGTVCPMADATIDCDLARLDHLDSAIRTVKPDAVLHLAAQAAVPASFRDPAKTWQVNLMATLALGEAVLRHAPAALFVQASSAEVYGLSFRTGKALDEDAPFAPANPYAASKAAADIALGEMALRGLHVLRLRPFNHVGRGQADAFVVAAFARQIAAIQAGFQDPVIRTGALDRWRDMLDVRDVASAYAAALMKGADIPAGTAFNIASGTPRRIGDILNDLISMAKIEVRIETEAGRLRPTDVEYTRGDATLAGNILDWKPEIGWNETLAEVLQDWQARIQKT